jgi:GNAT superfamily N-acetyltransferase
MLAESRLGQKPRRDAGEKIVLADGREVLIRPALSGDADRLRGMLARLSPQTIYKRFHSPFPRMPDWAVDKLLRGDGEILVAVAGEEMVGHAMGVRSADGREAEVAVLVEDAWQSAGVGKLLLTRLAAKAAERGVEVLTCEALGENLRVLDLTRAVFAEVRYTIQGGARLIRAPLSSLKAGQDRQKGEG